MMLLIKDTATGQVRELTSDDIEVLGRLTEGKTLTVAATASTSHPLTSTCRRFSVTPTVDCWLKYAVGTVTATAADPCHRLFALQRIDVKCLPGTQVSVIRAGSTDGSAYISEMA